MTVHAWPMKVLCVLCWHTDVVKLLTPGATLSLPGKQGHAVCTCTAVALCHVVIAALELVLLVTEHSYCVAVE